MELLVVGFIALVALIILSIVTMSENLALFTFAYACLYYGVGPWVTLLQDIDVYNR